MQNSKKLILFTKRLVKIPSVTLSKNSSGKFRENILVDYLYKNSRQLKLPASLHAMPDGRNFLSIFLKGSSRKTIVLLCHHDTVGVDDFHDVNPYDVDSLTRQAKDHMFLYGRGVGDMKSGIAVGLHLVEEFAKQTLKKNIIFLSVPDEESGSKGVVAAGNYLNKLKRIHNLEYEGTISLDSPTQEISLSSKNLIILGGLIGKMLPCFFVVGKAGAVSAPFHGISSTFISTEIVQQLEGNSYFSEKDEESRLYTSPPSCLMMRDLRTHYDTQLPVESFLYFNYFTLRETPIQVLEKMKTVAEVAMKNAFDKNKGNYKEYLRKKNVKFMERGWDKQIRVYTFNEILKMLKKNDIKLLKKLSKIIDQNNALDERELNLKVVSYVSRKLNLKSPYIICFFSPPYYPSSSSHNNEFISTIEAAVKEYSAKSSLQFELRKYSRGISDLNYLQMDDEVFESISAYQRNNPIEGKKNQVDFNIIKSISMPVANIGPRAFFIHERGEKVEIDYTFTHLPILLKQIILKLQTI